MILFITMALLGVMLAIGVSGIFRVLKVQGDSMAPVLDDGDFALINKVAYLDDLPKEGDIVAFSCNVYSEDGEGSTLAKRVVAVGGDTVEIKDGDLYLNGKVFNKYSTEATDLEPLEKMTIETGKVFVLSDHRTAIMDSRNDGVGQLPVEEIMGKVLK